MLSTMRSTVSKLGRPLLTRSLAQPLYQFNSRAALFSSETYSSAEEETAAASTTLPLAELKVHDTIKKRLARKGITELYEIQHKVLAPIMEGLDVIGKSKTGSGKTIAFGLPIIEALLANPVRPGRHQATNLIIVPTRELCKQVATELESVAGNQCRVFAVYGGVSYGPQVAEFSNGVDILVGTPGRILDHLQQGNLRVDNLRTLVLDEADEMLRIGFQKDIEAILSSAPESRQTVLFSATVPKWIHNVARRYQKAPVLVDVVGNEINNTSDTIKHVAICAPPDLNDKASLATSLIDYYNKDSSTARTLIFTQTKAEADRLAHAMGNKGAMAIHGDLTQANRERTLKQFRQGRCRILVATDVAARGIDIPEVSLILQWEFPNDPESYIHRSGRTGRAGRQGTCCIMFNSSQRTELSQLERATGAEIEVVYPPSSSMVVDDIKEVVEKRIKRQKFASPFDEVAELLVEEHGAKALVAVLQSTYGKNFATRSILTSTPGSCAVQVMGPRLRSKAQVAEVLSMLLPDQHIVLGHCEMTHGGAVVDVLEGIANKLMEEDSTTFGYSVTLPTELPKLIPPHYNNRNNGGRRNNLGGHSHRGRGGGGGGYQGGNRNGGYNNSNNYRGKNNNNDWDRHRGNNKGGYRGGGGGYQGNRNNGGYNRGDRNNGGNYNKGGNKNRSREFGQRNRAVGNFDW